MLPTDSHAQSRWDIPNWADWTNSRCVRGIDTAVMMPCGDFGQFLVTEMAIPGRQVCCGSITIESGQSLHVEGGIEYTACGGTFTLNLNWTQTQSFSTTFDGAFPCGCVQVMVQHDWRIQEFVRDYERCYPSGREERWTERRRVVDQLPNGTRLVPHYFTRVPSECLDCTPQGRPRNPSETPARGWDPLLPYGFPTTLPNARPRPEAIPWDINIHGPLRSSNDVFPDGRNKQLTIDMSAWGVARGIDSPLSMTLYERAEVYRSINEARQSPLLWGDKTAVRVVIARGVELTGSLGKLSSSLIASSCALVNSPTYGDFNGDEARDEADLALLVLHVNANESPADSRLFDVNGDGAVDELDVQKWCELVLG